MQKFNLMIRKTIMINIEKNNFKINIIYCILNTDEQVFFLFFLTKFSIIKNIEQILF